MHDSYADLPSEASAVQFDIKQWKHPLSETFYTHLSDNFKVSMTVML